MKMVTMQQITGKYNLYIVMRLITFFYSEISTQEIRSKHLRLFLLIYLQETFM
jgi:hypothetical protein